MDISLAKTFLAIMGTGTFIEAAQKLNITQTAVTSRVRSLEAQLGCTLFVRNRSGAKLTREGEVFSKYALALVQTWESAQAQLRLPLNLSQSVHIGADISLWNPIVSNWLDHLTQHHPSIMAHTEVAATEKLIEQLQLGNLDAIVVHQPNYFSGLTVEQVAEEKLVHVRSTASALPNLFIDWGADFKNKFDAALPAPRQAALSFNLGPLALKFMLSRGGNGYFRTRVVETYLRSGQLENVPDSPEFSYPIYVIYRSGHKTKTLENVIECLKISLDTDKPWVM